MTNIINTKLLLIIIALLASIVSYIAYEKHEQALERARTQQLLEQQRAGQKQANQGLQGLSKAIKDYRSK
jgi:hypothetical protein